MGRKKKQLEEKKDEVAGEGIFNHLQEETLQGIIAVLFFVLATFFMLAGFARGGKVGLWSYAFLKNLFGYGYWLLPILFFILCISFFNSLKKKLALTHSIGGILFFCSALGLLNIFTSTDNLGGKGGIIGNLISSPLLSLFDLYASVIILIAFCIISFLVMFDIPLKLHFASFFKKKEVLDGVPPETEPILAPATAQALAQANADEAKKEESKPLSKKIFGDDEKKEFSLAESFLSLSGKEFVPPPLTLLEKDRGKPGVGDIKANSNIIKRTLANFGINVEMDEVSVGPSITRYALKPAEGVKLSRILGLQNDLSLALAAHPIRGLFYNQGETLCNARYVGLCSSAVDHSEL